MAQAQEAECKPRGPPPTKSVAFYGAALQGWAVRRGRRRALVCETGTEPVGGGASSGRMACRGSVDLPSLLVGVAAAWPTFTSDLCGGDLLFFSPQSGETERQLPPAAAAAGLHSAIIIMFFSFSLVE